MISELPPESPQATASFFAHAILSSGDLRAAWAVTDEPLRRELAASWIDANSRHTVIRRMGVKRAVEELVAIDPLHFLWWHFAQAAVELLRARWADVDLETWGWAMRPRPATIDCESVLLVDRDNAAELDDESVACPAVEFLLRHDEDGWWVTGIGHGGATLTAPAA